MIVGTGVDLAEVPRIKASIERYGEKFIRRIYTAAEIAYVERKANKFERYAARFAAKEAGMKAIGTGWRRGVTWQDFEVANLPSGKPTLRFHGVAARFAESVRREECFALDHAHGGAGDGARDPGGLKTPRLSTGGREGAIGRPPGVWLAGRCRSCGGSR